MEDGRITSAQDRWNVRYYHVIDRLDWAIGPDTMIEAMARSSVDHDGMITS